MQDKPAGYKRALYDAAKIVSGLIFDIEYPNIERTE
jgi:hypothetical protein